MAINDPDPGRDSKRRGLSIRDMVSFGVGLLAFIGIGRLFRKYPVMSNIKHQANEPDDQHVPVENPEVKHEPSDVNIRLIVLVAVILVVGTALGHLTLWGMFRYFGAERAEAAPTPLPVYDAQQVPPQPRLQAAPEKDLQELFASENKLLNTYEWVDRDAGIVRIPIGRAMDLLNERGLPVREGGGSESEQIPGLEEGYELESEGGRELERTEVPPILQTEESKVETAPESKGQEPETEATPASQGYEY